MVTEKLFIRIERYIAAVILLLLLGLVFTDGGMRGFPFAWLGGGVDSGRLLLSAAVLAAVVICADIIAGVITTAMEPRMSTLTGAGNTKVTGAELQPAETVRVHEQSAAPSRRLSGKLRAETVTGPEKDPRKSTVWKVIQIVITAYILIVLAATVIMLL